MNKGIKKISDKKTFPDFPPYSRDQTIEKAVIEFIKKEEKELTVRQEEWEKRIDCKTGKKWKNQKCPACQKTTFLWELKTREGDWREGIRPDYLCPKCNTLLGSRHFGLTILRKRPEEISKVGENFRKVLSCKKGTEMQIQVEISIVGDAKVEFKHDCTTTVVSCRGASSREYLAQELRLAARKLVKGLGTQKRKK